MHPFVASVAQLASVPFEPMASAEKAAQHIARAGRAGSKLLVFPEALSLGFYPKGASFGAVKGQRTAEGRAAFQRYFETAIEIPGPETSLIADAAREAGIFVVMGGIERARGTLDRTALFFDGSKGLIGTHRKLMPTALRMTDLGIGDGSTTCAFNSLNIGRVGAVICWENYMPMRKCARDRPLCSLA